MNEQMTLAKFENIGGRDLRCKIVCDCPDPMFADSSVAYLFKRTVRLTGYDDDNFWRNVAGNLRTVQCVCGRELEYQWTEAGVEYRWLD